MDVTCGCGLGAFLSRNKGNGQLRPLAPADCRGFALEVPWKACQDGGMPSSQGRWAV